METKDKIWVQTVLKDFKVFARKHLKIKDKDGRIVPFVLNTAQLIVLGRIEEQIKAGVPIRLIVLKARQKGISTLMEAYIFWRTTFRYNRKAAIVGHKVDATNNLYAMTKRYFKYLDDSLKPVVEASNEKGIKYGILESEIKLYTAESGDVGSSDTLQDLHLTELSKWRDPKTSLTALLQTVPDKPNTLVVMESTAKGIGGEFYDRWQTAEAGKSNYIPVFLSWLIDDEYTLPFRDDAEKKALENSIDEIEEELVKAGATLEHLNWRRKIGLPDKCGGDVDMFRQEYPSNAVEAFVASGSPVFDVKKCYANLTHSENFVPKVGNLEWAGDKVVFRPNERGYVKLFKEIKLEEGELHRFASGVDVAEGLAQGDYSVCPVFDRKTDEVCLTWHGHIDMDLFSEEIYKIYVYLGKNVVFDIESNFGYGVINKLYNLGGRIKHNQTFDKGYPSDSAGLGFRTTSKSKKMIIDQLNEWIREGLFVSNENDFWKEALRFVRDDRGRMAAQGKSVDPSTKSFDDRVIAYALMVNCSLWLPSYTVIKKPEPVARPSFVEEYEIDEVTF